MAELNLNDGQIMAQTNANETPLNANPDETGAVISTPATNKTQAKNSAKGKVKTSAMTAIEAEAKTIGLPYLKARETITIENIGKKFSGEWRITKVRHEISSSGYTCSLSLAKNNFSGGINSVLKDSYERKIAIKSVRGVESNIVKFLILYFRTERFCSIKCGR